MNHSKPSYFLLYKPFNQSITLTKNAYAARFLTLNLTTILSSLQPFNQKTKQGPSINKEPYHHPQNHLHLFFITIRVNTTIHMPNRINLRTKLIQECSENHISMLNILQSQMTLILILQLHPISSTNTFLCSLLSTTQRNHSNRKHNPEDNTNSQLFHQSKTSLVSSKKMNALH
jgi:hypothetical protein